MTLASISNIIYFHFSPTRPARFDVRLPLANLYASAKESAAEALRFYVCRPALRPAVVCPSIDTYFAWGDISVLDGEFSVKIATNTRLVNENCERNVFKVKGQRSRSWTDWTQY